MSGDPKRPVVDLDDLDAEVVEDLEADEDDGEDVRGGSLGCMTF